MVLELFSQDFLVAITTFAETGHKALNFVKRDSDTFPSHAVETFILSLICPGYRFNGIVTFFHRLLFRISFTGSSRSSGSLLLDASLMLGGGLHICEAIHAVV